jgi:hypothetical protein
MIMYTKAKASRPCTRGSRVAALVASLLLISAIVFLTMMTTDSFAQGSTVSTNKTGTTSGNVTAQVSPQGTSLK